MMRNEALLILNLFPSRESIVSPLVLLFFSLYVKDKEWTTNRSYYLRISTSSIRRVNTHHTEKQRVSASLIRFYWSCKVLYIDITFTDTRTGLQRCKYYIWKLHSSMWNRNDPRWRQKRYGGRKNGANPVSLTNTTWCVTHRASDGVQKSLFTPVNLFVRPRGRSLKLLLYLFNLSGIFTLIKAGFLCVNMLCLFVVFHQMCLS